MATIEKWRPIPGYECEYEVSNLGRVKSIDRIVPSKNGYTAKIRGKILTPIKNKAGYLRVNLCNHRGRKAFFVHRLVAITFLDNPNNYPEINHKDEDKGNNCVENLEWCNAKYNSNYGTHKEKVAKSNIGKKKHYTPESFRRMVSPKEKHIIGVNCKTGEQIYFQSIASAKYYGFSPVDISHCINKRQKTHKNYIWEEVK